MNVAANENARQYFSFFESNSETAFYVGSLP
jgi:hypothetical protein